MAAGQTHAGIRSAVVGRGDLLCKFVYKSSCGGTLLVPPNGAARMFFLSRVEFLQAAGQWQLL